MLDVNILVYAANPEAEEHGRYAQWLEDSVNEDESFGLADLVLSGFLRIVTHPKICKRPAKMEDALDFAIRLRSRANCVVIAPGRRHWDIFVGLCRKIKPRGNLVPDTYFAALAIESGSEWISADRDYARFPGLRWRHPFDD